MNPRVKKLSLRRSSLKKIAQVNREMLELIEKLRADKISMEAAEVEIESAERIVESCEWTRQSGKGSNGMASKDTVIFVKSVVEMARRELEHKERLLGP